MSYLLYYPKDIEISIYSNSSIKININNKEEIAKYLGI